MKTLMAATAAVALIIAIPVIAQQQQQPPAASTPSTPPATEQKSETPKTEQAPSRELSSTDAAALIGKPVVGPDGKKVAEVENLLVTDDGKIRAAVLEYGGFIGLGAKTAIVEWDKLDTSGEEAKTSMSEEELRQAPPYDKDKPDPRFAGTKPLK